MSETGDQRASDLFLEASSAYAGGDTRRALELLDQALAVAPADGTGPRSFLLTQRVGWLRESGHPQQAMAAAEAAVADLAAVPVEGHETEWAGLRSEQGVLAHRRGDFAAAEVHFTEATQFAQRSPAQDLMLPDVYANHAALLMDQGRLSDAKDILLRALEVDQRVGHERNESNDLNMLGLVSMRLGDPGTAHVYFTRAREVAIEAGLIREAADATTNLAAIMDDAGQHAQAAELFKRTGELLGAGGDEAAIACSVANQGVAAAQAGDLAAAVVLLTRSHELHLAAGNQLHAVQDLINLSGVQARLGQLSEALEHAEEGLRAATDYGLVGMLWVAEHRVASCRLDLARDYVRGGPDGEVPIDQTAERATAQSKRMEEAWPQVTESLAGFRRAADYIELLRSGVNRPEDRESLLVGKEQVYEDAIRLCVTFGLGREAFSLCERARMRSFIDALGPARIGQLEAAVPGVGRRDELVRRLLDSATPASDKPGLLDELRTVRAELVASRPALAAVTGEQLPSVDDICAALPDGTAMVVYFELGDEILIFPVLRDQGIPGLGRTTFDEPVEELVQKFRREIEGSDEPLQAGNALFAALIRPVMPLLATTQRLIVVPHGVLHYVAFSALWFTPAGDDMPPREYLRNRFILTTVPSAGYLPLLAAIAADAQADPGADDPAASLGPAVVLGNPTDDLPGAEAEARDVAARLGVTALLGPAATRSAFLDAGTPAVLHVACHGTYESSDPLLSRLEMADGGVTVEDLLTAGPAPGVLVLSGCVTGMSARKPGDELVGLAQAMLRRGTRAVIATLWETFDESSAIFFGHFYQALTGGFSVSDSAAWARDALARGPEGFAQPVDWAPFVLIGDPSYRVVSHPDPGQDAYYRGLELSVAGDRPGALAEFRQAAADGGAEFGSMASYRAAQILADQGEPDAAMQYYQRALDLGDPGTVPLAALDVGAILLERGDIDGARAALQRAIDGDHREASPKAAYNLGVLLAGQGDLAAAREAYRRAASSGDAEIAPVAAFSLGMLLADQGDTEGAKTAWQAAILSGHPRAMPAAAYNLGVVLANLHEYDAAISALKVAIAGESQDMARAAAKLKAKLEKRAARRRRWSVSLCEIADCPITRAIPLPL